jgi:hypothetical protein
MLTFNLNPFVPMSENQTPNTGSLELVVSVLAQQVDGLTQQVHELKKEKLLKETQLSPEQLEQAGISLELPARTKRGNGWRPIMAHEILEAKKVLTEKYPNGFNETMVARYMRLNYFTYKKYAKMHNVWSPKPNIKGKRNLLDPERGKHPLSEILEGKHPTYSTFRIKDKLIRSGTKEEKCEKCGWHERSVLNGKVPLFLNFMDDNPQNHRLENMKLYCSNCTLTCGRGYFRSGKKYFDPDWLQR